MMLRRALPSIVFLFALLFTASVPLAWQPPRGSPVRGAIMDGLRPYVERDVGPPVMFNVTALNVEGPWAFASVKALRPNGQPVDWSRTRYGREMASGMMSDSILALLTGEGQSWRIVEYALGPTDVPWEDWVQKHRISRRLFENAYAGAPGGQSDPPQPPVAQPQPPAPQVQAASPPPPPQPPVASAPAGLRRWQLGDITFDTPGHWQTLDSQQAMLTFGGAPWNTTLSDRPMDTGRGVMLVLSWSDDEYIYSRSLDGPNILGRQGARLAGITAQKTYFSLRDRYNDMRGFDVVTTAEVHGGTLSLGCRAPNAQWRSIETTCEQILASVRLASAPQAPVAATPPQPQPTTQPPQPTAQPTPQAAPPSAADAGFASFTTALEKLEAYEKSKDQADWQAGLEAAQAAVEAQPDIADYWRTLGYAYALGGSDIQLASALAEEAYEKSVALDPKNAGTRMLLAALLLERQAFSKALTHIEAALEIKPALATSPVVADMCRIYLIDEQVPRGETYLGRLSAAHPRSHAARLGHAVMLHELKRDAEAVPLAQKVAADPQAPQADAEHAKALLKAWQG